MNRRGADRLDLKSADVELEVSDFGRKPGISQPTCYSWNSKYCGMSPAELKRFKELDGSA